MSGNNIRALLYYEAVSKLERSSTFKLEVTVLFIPTKATNKLAKVDLPVPPGPINS